MNRRNGNWQAPSISQLTATAVTDLAPLSRYRSIKPAALHPTPVTRTHVRPDRNVLLGGGKRTFMPFHRGVVTTYTLQVGAAGDGGVGSARATASTINPPISVRAAFRTGVLRDFWRPQRRHGRGPRAAVYTDRRSAPYRA